VPRTIWLEPVSATTCLWMVRVREAEDSFRIARAIIDGLPGGSVRDAVGSLPPFASALGYAESPRGSNVHWAMFDGEGRVYRLRMAGIETLLLGMIPIAATDGGKIYRWHRSLWAIFALAAAFLTWYVLLGRERSHFSDLRQTSSIAVTGLFVGYTMLTIGAWAFFSFRPRRERVVAVET
jgi:hypothetical protein